MRRMVWLIFVTVYSVIVTAFNFPVPDDDIYRMLPNERTSVKDCKSRYYRASIDLQVNPGSPVIGFGFPTQSGEFPHMAAIGWTQPNGTILWECGGSLIWDSFVLTAAHCAYKTDIKAPDVVRLGDIDLSSSEDDKWMQEFRIDKIIRHPKHSYFRHYHDIALFKLDRNVKITEKVIPACLWTNEEVRFKKLVATGWGQIGFALKHSPNLLKVSLEPISNEECSEYHPSSTRRLREGLLKDQHLCARDKKMDTCGGDSGGPLQINLLHNSRMSPFIVGVTSFGAACTRSVPGVYTRVATYYNWIINTMQNNGAVGLKDDYNETLCALRYAKYRERPLDPDTARIVTRNYPRQLATIRWNGAGPDCAGVIVDEDTVLTVADCTRYKGKSPSYIIYLDNKTMPIARIMIHPEHVHGSAYNNIAILKLNNLLDLPEHFIPSCLEGILLDGNLTGYGKGRRDLNSFDVSTVTVSQQVDLAIELNILNTSNCVISERFKPLMYDLDREHLCLGDDDFLVPGSCEQLTGSMLGSSESLYYTTHALTLSSRDCGFGEHLISTRIESHIDWLKTVLLPNYRCSRYIDPDLKEGDSCTLSSGLNGKCVSMDRCANQLKHIQEQVTMCSRNDVICCSMRYLKTRIQIHPRILNCSKIVKKYFRKKQRNASLVAIGWFGSKRTQFRCLGSIINRSFVLTVASCLRKTQPHVVKLMESSVVADINSILIHPKFNETDRSNDIALIRLKNPLKWNSSVHPICLWTNATETPMNLDINNVTLNLGDPVKINDELEIIPSKKLHPMYNSDCQKAHQHTIPDSQLCTRSPYHSAACVAPSDQLIWMDTDTNVKYLVGMSTNACGPYKWKYNVFTRISAFVEWISKYAFYNKI